MKRLIILPFITLAVWAVGFAPDQRHLAPNRRPFSALGRTSAHGGLGCAVLIGPDLALTCGHCVSDPERKLYDDVEIEFGLGFEPVTHKAKLKEAFMQQDVKFSIDGGQDWAIVRLDRPLGAYYGWLNCKYLSDAEWPDAEIELLGYCSCPDEARPQFGNMDRPYRCAGAVSDVGAQILFHNCAMWGGTSGAPVLARQGNSYALVALNFAGVSVQGEVLKNGFRETYCKELANLAIPARNWRDQLTSIPKSPAVELRTLRVQNNSSRPRQVEVQYRSVFDAPDAAPQVRSVLIAAASSKFLIDNTDGCADANVALRTDHQKGLALGLKAGENRFILPKSDLTP